MTRAVLVAGRPRLAGAAAGDAECAEVAARGEGRKRPKIQLQSSEDSER